MSKPSFIQNLAALSPEQWKSPGGKFHSIRRSLSAALGAPRDIGAWGGGHPFDVEHVTLPAGKPNFPFHAHRVMWEFYWVLSGRGSLRLDDRTHSVQAGDFFMCAPDQAHQLTASGDGPMEYLVISDNVPADVIHYPDSGKWNAKPGRLIFRELVDYFDGEDAAKP